MTTFPPSDTPLYNHPLPVIEAWLSDQGCERDPHDLHCWLIERSTWKAELCLEVDQLTVRYLNVNGRDIQRSFKYSLSRNDVEDAVFSGP